MVKSAVEENSKAMNEKMASLEKAIDEKAEEPGFMKNVNARAGGMKGSEIGDMDYKERTALQLRFGRRRSRECRAPLGCRCGAGTVVRPRCAA
jgi:hypothetical protein